jgi:hypothetical protein
VSQPQAEDITATKKPRLEEPLSASVDEAATQISPHDAAVSLPADADHTDADPAKVPADARSLDTKRRRKADQRTYEYLQKMAGKEYRTQYLGHPSRPG